MAAAETSAPDRSRSANRPSTRERAAGEAAGGDVRDFNPCRLVIVSHP
jgi:hypothetical protein